MLNSNHIDGEDSTFESSNSTKAFLTQSAFGFDSVFVLEKQNLQTMDLWDLFLTNSKVENSESQAGNLFAIQKFFPSNAGFLMFEKISVDYFWKSSFGSEGEQKVKYF